MKPFKMKCGVCGKDITWYNDVPLKAFCWGTEYDEHYEWSEVVPIPYNPYLKPYTKKLRVLTKP